MYLEAHYLAGFPATLEKFSRERLRDLLLNARVTSVTIHKVGARIERAFSSGFRIYYLTDDGWKRIGKRGAHEQLDEMDPRLLGLFNTRGTDASEKEAIAR